MTDIHTDKENKKRVRVFLPYIFLLILLLSALCANVLNIPLSSFYNNIEKEYMVTETSILESTVIAGSQLGEQVADNSDRNMQAMMQFLRHVQQRNEWSADDLKAYANSLGVGSFELAESSLSAEDYAASVSASENRKVYCVKPDDEHVLILNSDFSGKGKLDEYVPTVLSACTEVTTLGEDPIFVDAYVVDRKNQNVITTTGSTSLAETDKNIPSDEEEYEIDGKVYGLSTLEDGSTVIHHHDEAAEMDTYTVCLDSAFRRTERSIGRFVMIIFVCVLIPCVFYNFFIRRTETSGKEEEKYSELTIAKRTIASIIISVVFNLVAAVYAQYFYAVATCSLQDRLLIREAEQLVESAGGSIEAIRQQCRDDYLKTAAVISNYLSADPERQVSSELNEVKNIFGLDYIVIYDTQGKERVSDGSVWNMSFSDDPDHPAYMMNGLRFGRVGVFLDPYENSLTGKNIAAAAVPMKDGSYSVNGYLELGVNAKKTISLFSGADVYRIVASAIPEEYAGILFFDEESQTVKETQWHSIENKPAEDLGFTTDSLKPGYFSCLMIQNENCYITAGQVTDRIMTVVRPAGNMHVLDPVYTGLIAVLTVLCALITLYFMRMRKDCEMVYDAGWFGNDERYEQLKKEGKPVQLEDRIEKSLRLIQMIGIAVMIINFHGQFLMHREIPLFTEILQYKWNRGLNIFALTINIIIIEWTVLTVFLARRTLRRIGQMGSRHLETITRLLRSAIRYVSIAIVAYIVLVNFGINPEALASSAGLIGIAIGIGARDLITDIVAGLFIIFEKDYEVGDLVSVNDYTGRVHEIGMRITKLTGLDGSEKIINNRNMTNVVNESMHPDAISVKFRVPYETDIAWLKKIVEEAAVTWKEKYPEIEKGPVFSGIAKFEDDMVLCGVWLTSTDSSPAVMTAKINFELKKLMDENGIPMKRELAIREKAEQE